MNSLQFKAFSSVGRECLHFDITTRIKDTFFHCTLVTAHIQTMFVL